MTARKHEMRNSANDMAGSSADLTWKASRSRTIPSWPQIEAKLNTPLAVPPIELWVVRHGETTTNAQGLVTGTSDPPLTEEGHRQARVAGLELEHHRFEIAWSSTLRRSRETLSDILEAGDIIVGSVHEDERIRERSLGQLELSPARPIPEFARGDLSFAPPGGESYEEVTRRCLSFLLDLAALAVVLERRSKLLVCSHVGPMRILAGILDRVPDPAAVLGLRFSNSSPSRYEMTELRFPEFLSTFRESDSRATA